MSRLGARITGDLGAIKIFFTLSYFYIKIHNFMKTSTLFEVTLKEQSK